MARTADQVLKAQIGDLYCHLAALTAQVEQLQEDAAKGKPVAPAEPVMPPAPAP